MSEPIRVCNQEGCKVAQDGKCIEGLPLVGAEKCPNLTILDETPEEIDTITEEEIEEDDDRVSEEASVTMLPLPSGEELTLEECSALMGNFGAQIIVIAGESESGKTTVLSCVHELFRRGPYAGYLFARSRTLRAFERVCHESRVDSGQQTPDTKRTQIEEDARFFHLAVRRITLETPTRHLLISNISGEDFREARTSSVEASKMDYVRHADHFVLILDGERLANPRTRAVARRHAQDILRRFTQLDMLGKNSLVDVLFSKWDVLQPILDSAQEASSDSAANQLQEFLVDTKQQFEQQFGPKLGRLRFFEVAARPHQVANVTEGHGMEEVFCSWIEESAPEPERTIQETAAKKTRSSPKSAMDREATRFVASRRSAK